MYYLYRYVTKMHVFHNACILWEGLKSKGLINRVELNKGKQLHRL